MARQTRSTPRNRLVLGTCLRAFAAGLLLIAAATGQAQEVDPPYNIVLVLADDIGAGELGCYGHPTHKTPNLDRLAAEGMRFETCYSAPLCTPTRVMTLTGQYGFRTGYFQMLGAALSPRVDSPQYEIGAKLTFADLAKSRDYATALAGKWQLTGKIPDLIHDCGFDTYRMWAYTGNLPPGVTHTGAFEGAGRTSRYWHPSIVENGQYLPTRPDDYGPTLFTDFLIDFIKNHRDRPFLAYYPMPLTHNPHVETPDPEHPGQRLPAGYDHAVAYLDHEMGRLVAAIDEAGLARRTVFLFVGDNGTGGDGKGQLIEKGVRVPFIARCPGLVKPGVVSRALTDVSDIWPTIAELIEAPVPSGHVIDGRSLVPVLTGKAETARDWIFSFLGRGRILRDERWLLLAPGDEEERLYDCGDSRDGSGYRLIEATGDAQAQAVRARFDALLAQLPGPDNHPGLRPLDPAQEDAARAQKKAQRKAQRKSAQKAGGESDG